jgi:hypothetical protein
LMDPAAARFWQRDRSSFDTWVRWRTEKAVQLQQDLLKKVASLRPLRRIVMTAIDDRYAEGAGADPALGVTVARNIGANTRELLKVLRGTPHELQIEDESELWTGDPRRYGTFPGRYPEVAPTSMIINVNVIDRDRARSPGLTTTKPRGFELGASVASIGTSGARLGLYASSSIADEDYPWLKFSLAAGSSRVAEVSPGRMTTTSSTPFRIRVVRPAHRVRIDGKVTLYSGSRSVLVPAGNHIVEFDPPQTRTARRR